MKKRLEQKPRMKQKPRMSSEEAQRVYWHMLNDGAWDLAAKEIHALRAEVERLKNENALLRELNSERRN